MARRAALSRRRRRGADRPFPANLGGDIFLHADRARGRSAGPRPLDAGELRRPARAARFLDLPPAFGRGVARCDDRLDLPRHLGRLWADPVPRQVSPARLRDPGDPHGSRHRSGVALLFALPRRRPARHGVRPGRHLSDLRAALLDLDDQRIFRIDSRSRSRRRPRSTAPAIGQFFGGSWSRPRRLRS